MYEADIHKAGTLCYDRTQKIPSTLVNSEMHSNYHVMIHPGAFQSLPAESSQCRRSRTPAEAPRGAIVRVEITFRDRFAVHPEIDAHNCVGINGGIDEPGLVIMQMTSLSLHPASTSALFPLPPLLAAFAL